MRLQFLLKNKCSLRSKIRAGRAASAARRSRAAFWTASGQRPEGGERATPPWKNSTPAHQPGGREESFYPCLRPPLRAPQQGNRTEPFTGRSGGRPGGAFPPLPPRSFSGGREESFHPCLRASFGRLNRTTGRSLLPDGRESGRRLSGSPFRCRTEGAAQSRRDDEAAKVGNNPQKI